MIQATGLHKAYGGRAIFEDAGFVLGRGERMGLVGRNGSGKTTLLRMLIGREHPDDGVIALPTGYRVGHLEQHIRFTCSTVLEEGASALPKTEDGRDESYRLKSILHGLGFEDSDLSLPPSALPGGFQVRLNLAKALVGEPDLLLLDEPTNYLDIVSIGWLKGFLRQWPGELIIITHDRGFMDQVTTHTMAIHRRRFIKVPGSTEKLYSQIMQDEEHYEKARANEERKRRDAERFIARFRAQATRARAVQSRIKSLSRRQTLGALEREKNLDFAFKSAPFIGKTMMEVDGLSFGWPSSSEPLIRDFSMWVRPGDRIGIIGRNGAGKTTLLNLLAGESVPTAGTVKLSPKASIAYFGQTNVERLNPELTIEEELMATGVMTSHRMARDVAGCMMFEGDEALKKIRVLSGGEKSRVLLAKLLLAPANMLLLDEPTNHLDHESIDSLLLAIEDFSGAVIIVTHSEMVLDALAERLVVFDNGRVSLFEGTYSEFLAKGGFASMPVEGVIKSPAPDDAAARSAAPRTYVDPREAKRLRAELINARSRELRPLMMRMEELEALIISLEEKLDKDNHALAEASARGKGALIAELSRATHEGRQRIGELFEELERTTLKHSERQRYYAVALGEITA